YNRPVSDLKVTYLIFPGTADKPFGPPDLDKLQARCEALVKEIGGASVPLHHWEKYTPPPPTPPPTPSPSPSPSPAQSPSPGGSPAASPSPSPTFAFPTSSPGGPTAAGTGSPTLSPTTTPGMSPRRLEIALRLISTARRLHSLDEVTASALPIFESAQSLSIA